MSSKTNPKLQNLIADLKSVSRDSGANVWQDIAARLESHGARRTHAEVNLGRIERYAQEDETVVVPGKVLGSGVLEKNVTVAAVDFSGTAARRSTRPAKRCRLNSSLNKIPKRATSG